MTILQITAIPFVGLLVGAAVRLLAMLWASPYTFVGILIGLAGLCTGGRARIRGRVIEFYGGGVKWLLHRFS